MIRVTEPLNYFKEPWYIDWVHSIGRTEANKISKSSMKIGSRVDGMIKADPFMIVEKIGVKPKENEVKNCLSAYMKWLEIYKPKAIVPCGRYFASIEGEEVSGEPDIMVDGVLVDIKCSSKISPSYWLQVNTYVVLRGETTKVGILRLDKVTGSFEYQVQDYDPGKFSVWCGMLRAYVYFNKERQDGDEL